MKTILLCIATLFFMSCSADSDFETTPDLREETETVPAVTGFPANAANPFDSKGKAIYDALQAYHESNKAVNSVEELTDQIRYIFGKLNEKRSLTGRLIPFTNAMVDSIMSDPDNIMIAIVQSSSLQTYAKGHLIDFLQELINKRQQQFSVTYSYIITYESDVVNSTVLNADEKETMLTVASISRYSLYSEEERKDKDWDILIGNKPSKRFFKTGEVPIISIIALLEQLL